MRKDQHEADQGRWDMGEWGREDPTLKITLQERSQTRSTLMTMMMSRIPCDGDADSNHKMAASDNLVLLFYVAAWYIGNTFYNIVSPPRLPVAVSLRRLPTSLHVLRRGGHIRGP